MQSFNRSWLALGVLLIIGFGGYSLGETHARRDEITIEGDSSAAGGFQVIRDAFSEILTTSTDPPSGSELARGAVKGMIQVLKKSGDPYALFYSPRGYRDFQELTSGRFSGIGVWLKEKGGRLEIVSVLPSTPAKASGLQSGDVIVTVDGQEVEGLTSDEAIGHIKGPEGTEVVLGIDRDGATLSFTITREELELPNVIATMTSNNLGHIQLLGFSRGAGRQLRSEVEGLLARGADGLILDMRGNGGGLFSEAIDVASVFIEKGEIVTYRQRGESDVVYDAEGDAFEKVPLVVLVDEGTASASEIVAGALQDSERAVLVGETTYGKGSVQEIVPLLDASAIKITTASYLTPEGRNINGHGIEPDVEEDGSPRAQLSRAVEILKGILISTADPQG